MSYVHIFSKYSLACIIHKLQLPPAINITSAYFVYNPSWLVDFYSNSESSVTIFVVVPSHIWPTKLKCKQQIGHNWRHSVWGWYAIINVSPYHFLVFTYICHSLRLVLWYRLLHWDTICYNFFIGFCFLVILHKQIWRLTRKLHTSSEFWLSITRYWNSLLASKTRHCVCIWELFSNSIS
jgi:hypothetical protein